MSPSSIVQDASQNVKVAAVVSFYMTAALIVRRSLPPPSPFPMGIVLTIPLGHIYRWYLCTSRSLGPIKASRTDIKFSLPKQQSCAKRRPGSPAPLPV